jgi:hypothetical protein
MDTASILEPFHQFRKSFWLDVPRKHGVVNHGQGLGTEVEEIASLRGAILKSDNLAGPFRGSPKQRTMVQGEINKEGCPSIHPLFLGSSISKGSYQKKKKKKKKTEHPKKQKETKTVQSKKHVL